MNERKMMQFCKKAIEDNRILLWITTIGGFALAFLCVFMGYVGTLPWIGAMVGLPWGAHATICSFYMKKSEKENTAGGIVFEKMKMDAIREEYNWESPEI